MPAAPVGEGGSSFLEDALYDGTTRNYSFHYDYGKFAALWVAYPLQPSHISGSTTYECDKWASYPDIAQTSQVNIWSGSYNVNLGQTTTNGYDSTQEYYARGHQIPNADRNRVSQTMVDQTYYAINSTPQIQNKFNGGIWMNLENAIRAEVSDYGDVIYIATGPVYQTAGGSETITYIHPKHDSAKAVPLPNYYYKVLLKVGSNGKASAVGFWFEHKEYSSSSSYASYAVSVDEVEQKTGLNFFVNLEGSLEESAEQNNSWTTFCNF